MNRCQSCWNVISGPTRVAGYCDACTNRLFFVCDGCHHYKRVGFDTQTLDGHRLCEVCFAQVYPLTTWAPACVSANGPIEETGSNRCYGIELETSFSKNHRMLRGHTVFGAKYDGSVQGMEFDSPILYGSAGLKYVRDFCKLAKKLKFRVDSDCGYHLHLDMRTTSTDQRKAIIYAYFNSYRCWATLVDSYRAYDCRWCQCPSIRSDYLFRLNPDQFREWRENASRYEFINIRALDRHQTIEIRGYQGTLNPVEICNWIKAHLRFVDSVENCSQDTLDGYFKSGDSKRWASLKKLIGPELARYYGRKRNEVANAIC